jgi:hypothetical protein
MRRIRSLLSFIALALLCGACSTAKPAGQQNGVTLDSALADAGSYFINRLPQRAKIAVVGIDAQTPALSDYVFEEIWNQIENAGTFLMVDRRNLERIRVEMNYQLSGEVSDESARSIGHQYGADIIIYGQITPLGDEYRLTLYATDVEKASSNQRTFTIHGDRRLASLLTASLDDQIEQAVAAMARGVQRQTTIAVGRISYADTQTVSNLSAYLKNGIITEAQRIQSKFLVASDSDSADFAVATRGLTVETPEVSNSIQAVVLGNFSPVDKDAKVSVRLVSTGGNPVVLAAADFVVSATELERRKLTLLPEKNTAVISAAEFEKKQQAIDPYSGKNNRFAFTVSPDDLDGVYYEGEYMTMWIYSERNCYFRIVHVDVNGTAQVIYPMVGKDNNFIRAGESRRIPDNTRYRMGGPYGEEYILVAAYDKPFEVRTEPGGSITDGVINRALYVETGNGQGTMSPIAAAKFSYTILPK